MQRKIRNKDNNLDYEVLSPEVLKGKKIEVVDLRADWLRALEIIENDKLIQARMTCAYTMWLRDYYVCPNPEDRKWSYEMIKDKQYLPCFLPSSDWICYYRENEWEIQASEFEKEALDKIRHAFCLLDEEEGNEELVNSLNDIENKLESKQLPRLTQPETWRPQHAAHCVVVWVIALAQQLYKDLAKRWCIITNEYCSVVAGFAYDGTVYLVDLAMLLEKPDEILDTFKKPKPIQIKQRRKL